MFPAVQLTNVASDIRGVRDRIATRRRACLAAVKDAARPLGVIDAAVELGRRLRPLLPSSFPATRRFSGHLLLRKFCSWLLAP